MQESRVLVNLGCGSRARDGWINIDYSLSANLQWVPILRSRLKPLPPGYRNWNLRNGIPLQSNSADVVYASHVLEHIDHAEAPRFVAEIARVLKSEGIVRLVVPDLETAARNYLAALDAVRSNQGDRDADHAHELATILFIDQMVRRELGGELASWLRAHVGSPVIVEKGGILAGILQSRPRLEERGRMANALARVLGLLDPVKRGEVHRWMYDEHSLTRLLWEHGFREVVRLGASDSRVDGWANFELDTDHDGSTHHPDSLWVEAVK